MLHEEGLERLKSHKVNKNTLKRTKTWLSDLMSGACPVGGGGGGLGSGFAGYVPLASQNPHPIIVYSVANYRPYPSHFWANAIVIMRADC